MASSTKQDIVRTLGRFLRERRLDEIKVTDLTEACGISRQAFYYHFSDLYDVVKWGTARELERLSGMVAEAPGDETKQDWERLLELVEDRMLPNRTVVLNVYRAFERSFVHYHLMNGCKPIMAEEIEKQAKNYRVTNSQKEFVVEWTTMCLINVFLGWLDQGMPSRSVEHLDDFRAILDGSMEFMLGRLEQKNME